MKQPAGANAQAFQNVRATHSSIMTLANVSVQINSHATNQESLTQLPAFVNAQMSLSIVITQLRSLMNVLVHVDAPRP